MLIVIIISPQLLHNVYVYILFYIYPKTIIHIKIFVSEIASQGKKLQRKTYFRLLCKN